MRKYSGLGTESFVLKRRQLMQTAIGILALGVTTRGFAAGMPEHASILRSDLFAFQGRNPATIILASVFEGSATSLDVNRKVDFHVGDKTWSLGHGQPLASHDTSAQSPVRSYLGSIGENRDGSIVNAAVLELPIEAASDGVHAVWAEILGGGARHRVGNPIVGLLLKRDPKLAVHFHEADPSSDLQYLTEPFAERVGFIASGAGMRNPAAHGMRVAGLALPNVLPIDIGRPVGFNFAVMNGRHPLDDAEAVSEALLTGRVNRQPSSGNFKFTNEFPYFYGIS